MIGPKKSVSVFSKLVPFGIALVVLFLSSLPFGIDDSMLTLGPQLALCVVFYWTVRAPHLLPPASVFLLGLSIDLFSAGPLGFWGLIYLAAYAVISTWPDRFSGKGLVRDLLGFAVIAAMTTALVWAFGSVYFGVWIPVLPLALGGLVTVAVYAPMAKLFDYVSRPRAPAPLAPSRQF